MTEYGKKKNNKNKRKIKQSVKKSQTSSFKYQHTVKQKKHGKRNKLIAL